MTYIVDVNNATSPADTDDVLQGAEEFRAIKGKLNTISAIASGDNSPSVRQTVLVGHIDANGHADFCTINAGFPFNVDGRVDLGPIVLAYAVGFSNAGPADIIQQPTGFGWTTAIPSNTSYLASEYAPGSPNPTEYVTLAPPQYGNFYRRDAQSVMNFTGVIGTNVFTDDFGNAWVAQGAAKYQNNYVKFNNSALGGGGAANALDGAADYVKSVDFKGLGTGAWALRSWLKPTALPGVGVFAAIGAFTNAAGYGAVFGIYNNAGTIKFAYQLSSTGAATDIATNVQGTTTPIAGTEYFVELTYDQLAGTYRLYVNGAQEATTVSARYVCGIGQAGIGANPSGAQFFTGYIDAFEFVPYCQHPAGTAYSSAILTEPDIRINTYASEWFDTINYVMKSISIGSFGPGLNPGFVNRIKLYIAECDADAAHVTAVRTYAIQGKTTVDGVAGVLNAIQTLVHNIGTYPGGDLKLSIVNIFTDAGYTSGQEVPVTINYFDGANARILGVYSDKKNVYVNYNTANLTIMHAYTAGSGIVLTAANWKPRIRVSRGF